MAEFVSDSTKLLPCPNPWCDCPDGLFVQPLDRKTLFGVQCSCGFEGPVMDSEQRAIAAWNTRAAPPAMDREAVERIYVRWSDDGQFIRKWSREPFAEGEPIDAVAVLRPMGRAPGHDEVPTIEQAIRWLARFEHQDEVASTTPRKIAFELAGIHSLLSTLSADAIRQGEGEPMARIGRDQYPEIIQAARWMDEDNGTPHFQPGVGFIIDDPDGLTVPARWVEYLPTIEAALLGLDHERPHPDDADTLAWLVREGKEPTLYESAVHCFVSGEHTPVTVMANSSRELWIANRFFNERFEGWAFDPAADFPALNGPSFTGVEAWDELVNVDDRTSPEEYPDMCLITRDELIEFMSRATPASHASDGGEA